MKTLIVVVIAAFVANTLEAQTDPRVLAAQEAYRRSIQQKPEVREDPKLKAAADAYAYSIRQRPETRTSDLQIAADAYALSIQQKPEVREDPKLKAAADAYVARIQQRPEATNRGSSEAERRIAEVDPVHIVDVEAPTKGAKENRMPKIDDLDVAVGINFSGPDADNLRKAVEKKGATRFVEGSGDRCHVRDEAVLCFSHTEAVLSDSYSGSSSSSFGGGSASGSWNLEQMSVRATADLIRKDGERIPLGYAIGWADAGTNSSSGSGIIASSSSTSTTPRSIAAAKATTMAVMRLVDSYHLYQLGGHTKVWYPNARAELKKAFGSDDEDLPAPAAKELTPLEKVQKQVTDTRTQIQALKNKQRADKGDAEKLRKANAALATAETELKKLQTTK